MPLKREKAENYCRWVDLCSDGIYWMVKFEVFADVRGKVDFPSGTKTDQWVQRAASLRIKAMWVKGRTHHQMESGDWVAEGWVPAAEANPFEASWVNRRAQDQEEEQEEEQEQEQEQEQAEVEDPEYLINVQHGVWTTRFCSLCEKEATDSHLQSQKHRNKVFWLRNPTTRAEALIIQELIGEGLVTMTTSSQWGDLHFCKLCGKDQLWAGLGHFQGKEHLKNTRAWEARSSKRLSCSPPPVPNFGMWAAAPAPPNQEHMKAARAGANYAIPKVIEVFDVEDEPWGASGDPASSPLPEQDFAASAPASAAADQEHMKAAMAGANYAILEDTPRKVIEVLEAKDEPWGASGDPASSPLPEQDFAASAPASAAADQARVEASPAGRGHFLGKEHLKNTRNSKRLSGGPPPEPNFGTWASAPAPPDQEHVKAAMAGANNAIPKDTPGKVIEVWEIVDDEPYCPLPEQDFAASAPASAAAGQEHVEASPARDRDEIMDLDDAPTCQACNGNPANDVENGVGKTPEPAFVEDGANQKGQNDQTGMEQTQEAAILEDEANQKENQTGVEQTQAPAIAEDEANQRENEQRGIEKNQDQEAIRESMNQPSGCERDQAKKRKGMDQKKETVNQQEAHADPAQEKKKAQKVEKEHGEEDQSKKKWQVEHEPDDSDCETWPQPWPRYADVKKAKFNVSGYRARYYYG